MLMSVPDIKIYIFVIVQEHGNKEEDPTVDSEAEQVVL